MKRRSRTVPAQPAQTGATTNQKPRVIRLKRTLNQTNRPKRNQRKRTPSREWNIFFFKRSGFVHHACVLFCDHRFLRTKLCDKCIAWFCIPHGAVLMFDSMLEATACFQCKVVQTVLYQQQQLHHQGHDSLRLCVNLCETALWTFIVDCV